MAILQRVSTPKIVAGDAVCDVEEGENQVIQETCSQFSHLIPAPLHTKISGVEALHCTACLCVL